MKKSLTLNAIMSGIKTILQIIFPLITFPYISNILQVNNLGKVNFASSVCGYFLLFAGLGISSYAVREGSRYVNDREKAVGFCIGDVLHQYDLHGPDLCGIGGDDAFLDKAPCLYRPDAGAEFTDLLYDHRYRMGVHDL